VSTPEICAPQSLELIRGPLLAIACSAILLAAAVLRAQAKPEFDVASIKPSSGDDGRTLVQLLPGGGLQTASATLRALITLAYNVRSYQVSGGSGWIDSDRFDVVAKSDVSVDAKSAPRDSSRPAEQQYKTMQEQMRPKLHALLADRFQLRLHRETREAPIYDLVIAKSGTKLQHANNFRGLRIGRGQFIGTGATPEMLTTALANHLGRPVRDRTGLEGAFNFKWEWTPDGPPPPGIDAPPAGPNGPSIFTALEEQLGLTLKSTRGPIDVLVIDYLEKPSPN